MLLRNVLQASGLWALGAQALTLDITQDSSIIDATNQACDNAMGFYQGNKPGNTPGIPNQPYYWWEAGGLFGTLIQRWSITGNTSLNNIVTQGIQFQVGDNKDFEPANQTKDLGNDDQVFWAFAALDAAEMGFPAPPSGDPSWTALAQAVFNRQTDQWDTQFCGGGMRWQIVLTNPGYDYKNTMTNGGYFQLAARLARYTGNATYAKYAERMYSWLAASPMFDNTTAGLQIWDGIHIANCSGPEEIFWTYNTATMLMGAAYMYNYTDGAGIWQQRIQDLLHATNIFYVQSNGPTSTKAPTEGGQILSEVACEYGPGGIQTCNQDEPSFKAYSTRWFAMTTVLAPFTYSTLWPRIQASAQGAATQCVGSAAGQPPGTSCGRRWYQTSWDGFSGLGEHMSAMSAFQSLLIAKAKPPLTLANGGTSKGDASAGSGGDDNLNDPFLTNPITAADKFGASVLTVLSIGLAVGGSVFMVLP